MDWTAILALITEAEPLVANILSAWATPTNTMGKVAAVAQTLSAASQTTLGQIAAIQFPRLAASVGAAAVLLQIKHPTAIQEVQGALNLLGAAGVFALPGNKQLTIDGVWGPKTTAAAEAAEAKAGITLSGGINDALINWIGGELAKVG